MSTRRAFLYRGYPRWVTIPVILFVWPFEVVVQMGYAAHEATRTMCHMVGAQWGRKGQ